MAVANEDYFYEALPFAETHPDHLGAIGVLFGLRPAPPARCRVLEIGTATGGNVLPMAAAFPESRFVALDRAEDSLAVARKHAEGARLRNVALHLADIREFEDEPNAFDYIVCHGVYSWVPDDAREAIRRVVRRHLAPHGLAYISFNTLPGWHLRGAIRDMLRREVPAEGSAAERVEKARAFLRFLGTETLRSDPTRAWLASELETIAELSDHYLLGEHLVTYNHAEYFADFARDMKDAGLAFVTDAQVPLVFPERLGPAAAEAVRARAGNDLVAVQQSLDLLELRCFRRAILCRDDAPLSPRVSADRLSSLVLASPLSPGAMAPDLAEGVEETFVGPGGAIGTDQATLKAALVTLAAYAPGGLSFDALAWETGEKLGLAAFEGEARARLARNLLGLYTKGAIRLWASAKPAARAPDERPRAFPFARYQASIGSPFCTTLLHEGVQVDSFDRVVLARMDGTRDAAALTEAALDEARRGVVSVEMNGAPCVDGDVFAEIMEQKLLRFARMGLLME
ncbi:methyltransferase regulatory domain-containing protein [Polyangium sorediatum]|uniref:Methyltransferase regulatory domain-containing protein n=1 Tax=Polyangium sorediatum TaxID=889274 RepID=A0ABT6P734_9BACT|nr:methyltransferase regulatory domain-containing protein [Polyangium sorediatum]MDI1436366.1 methyltransferase regulatory domain-containing protein [Polyangium sorediatum]